jgi:catechol 2,3-dioxygenase-like lactoylglutathione lyase family enzyme
MDRVALRRTSVVFVVADIAATIPWYVANLGFVADPFPAAPPHTFCVLDRDGVTILLQQLDGHVKPDLYARRDGGVWDVYVDTVGVAALYEELSRRPDVRVVRAPHRQPYGNVELEVADPNGYVLVFAEPAAPPPGQA